MTYCRNTVKFEPVLLFSLNGPRLISILVNCFTTILDSSNLKEFADNNFEFDENGRKSSELIEWQKVLKTDRKHCERMRNC